jgi:hypothetical protein
VALARNSISKYMCSSKDFLSFFAAMLVDELTKNDIMNRLPFVMEAGKVGCKKKIKLDRHHRGS